MSVPACARSVVQNWGTVMSLLFDDQAVEAAAKALHYAEYGGTWDTASPEYKRQYTIDAHAALYEAVASLRERGKLEEHDFVGLLYAGASIPFKVIRGPVAIIPLPPQEVSR